MGSILYPVLEFFFVNCVLFVVERAFLRGAYYILSWFCIWYFALYFPLTGPLYGGHIAQTVGTLPFR